MTEPDHIPQTFLGLPESAAAYARARVVVLPIPFEATTSYGSGTRDGPAAILAASRQVETYDADLGADLADAPIHTAAPLAPDFSSPSAMTDRIHAAAARYLADGKWVLGLGGEHAVTLGLVRAAADVHGPLSLLQVDAHLDLRDAFEGTPYSHASVMRRCLDEGHRTVHVGIRNVSQEEAALVRDRGLPVFYGRDCAAGDAWIDQAVDVLADPVYVTFDVDGLDPSVIRTTGTPEPGGLGWWQAMTLLARVFARRRVVGADVVELAAAGDRASDFAAARLAARLAALALHGSP